MDGARELGLAPELDAEAGCWSCRSWTLKLDAGTGTGFGAESWT